MWGHTAKYLLEAGQQVKVADIDVGALAQKYGDAASLSEEMGRKITYSNPKPRLAKRYWIDIRGLDREYSTVMGMLYLMTRMGTAKKVTTVFEVVTSKKSRTFRQFVRKNLDAWR